jgi:integrative and conjugative element protein (TIGR02256 family)
MLVLVPQQILVSIRLERSKYLPRETGGFLIGMRRGDHIEVTNLTRQSEGDIATPSSFERASAAHRKAILSAWTRSGELDSLVGDWHSHPDAACQASSIDRRSWSKLRKAVGAPVVGLIDCGANLSVAYASTGRWLQKVTELTIVEQAESSVVYRAGDEDERVV